MNYRFLYAVAILIGMIVGAGTFGLPYVFSQAGFFIGLFYLLVIGLAVLLMHLFYGELILRTNQPHHLVGYAGKYFGPTGKKIVSGVILFEYYGALLVYLILGGEFLSIIFGRWLGAADFFWVMTFFLAAAFGIYCRLNTFAKSEFFLTLLLLAVVATLIAVGLPEINFANFTGFNLANFFLPYGVILFAMAGGAAIPAMRHILTGQEKNLKKAIFFGTLIPVVLYLFFAFVVVGISGPATSEEAIKGLVSHLGGWVTITGAIFGLLAVYTSFLVVGMAVRRIYHKDYRLKNHWSFALACVVPLTAYFFGLKNFILIIGFIGAVASGLDGIFTTLIYFRARKEGDRRPEYRLPWARVLGSLLIILFSLGIIYQFVYLTK